MSFLTVLTRINLQCDVIILTECWLSHCTVTPVIDGYNSFSTNNAYNQNDGIVVYVKECYNVKIEEPTFTNANCLVIKLNSNTVIVSVYRSPSCRNIKNFCENLDLVLTNLKIFDNIIVIGDLNIDINRINPDTSHYLDLLAFHGLLAAHHIPTRYNSCIDHVMLKTKVSSKTLVLTSSITDHESVLLSLKIKKTYKHNTINSTNINHSGIAKSLSSLSFAEIYNSNDANFAINKLIDILQDILEKNTNIKKYTRRNRLLKPWMTPGLLRCIKHRDRLHAKVKSFPIDNNIKITYTRYRNFCNSLLKKLKRNYDREELQKAGTNNKQIWRVIKNIANINSITNKESLLLSPESPVESINKINIFFADIGKKFANEINNNVAPPDFSHYLTSNGIPNSFVMCDTDENEVKNIILSLKNNCASGWDGIPISVLKNHSSTLIPLIAHICNVCFSTGTFPSAFKKSIIRPIYKGGDGGCVNNYRPISILTSLSKVLEKIINTRLIDYLQRYNLLSDQQYGFRNNKSTTDAVHDLTNFIVKNMDNGNKCLSIFLDLAKAFDTVSIPLLLHKLESIGIRGNQLKLFTDFLSDRRQCVKIDNVISSELPVIFGIPQGSILGPTLFLIYINDLCRMSLRQGKIVAFADDTSLCFQGKTWQEVFSVAQEGFNVVAKWLNYNILTLNTSKTTYLTFSIRNSSQPPISLDKITAHVCNNVNTICSCSHILRSSSTKYLGIQIDQNLNFKNHVNALTKRMRKLIYLFKSLRSVIELKLLKNIYLALCQSLVTYCITVWGGINVSTLLPLERVVRVILKVGANRPMRYPTNILYNDYSVLNVRQLYIKNLMIRMYAVLGNEKCQSSEVTRKINVFSYDAPIKTSFIRMFYPFLGVYLYNKLNKVLNYNCKTKYECKNLTIKWLMNKTYSETENLLKIVV